MEKSNNHSKVSSCVLYARSAYHNFSLDIENFISLWEKEKSMNYTDFATIWQNNNFTLIFAGQSYMKYLKLLCEITLSVVKNYLFSQENVYVQIGAFYLLYAFFYKQPIRKDVTIRLTLEEHRSLKRLLNKMLDQGQYDALYIYAKMKTDEAFDFVGQPSPLYLTSKNGNDTTLTAIGASRQFSAILSDLEKVLKSEAVDTLDKTCTTYATKMAVFAKRHPGLMPPVTTIMNDLKETYTEIMDCGNSVIIESDPKDADLLKRQAVRRKAVAAQTSEYRGSKIVITAADLDK
ncbi:uncharacterized protein LOC109542132 isoform X1 [Dendroctonus ponderosae]|uniref:snRNA-activating protein complex subunit 1 n=1 Tax=Dendroctonus ponderosae TaxID=77166 RepID=U4UL30_DENPD|nr:uncharacterized protein LOC109542132 isoform X1 [Dendroctonus ponderosae]ERL90851.1 hypothetical protein D910_08196 [Dendroctonus ponderosae]